MKMDNPKSLEHQRYQRIVDRVTILAIATLVSLLSVLVTGSFLAPLIIASVLYMSFMVCLGVLMAIIALMLAFFKSIDWVMGL